MTEDLFSYANPAPNAPVGEGILAGIQLAVQPNLSVKGWPTCAGSRALEGFIALEDATVVERLLGAGGRIAGLTQIAELGFGLHGDTSAAAVASSRCDAALVTDTLGEARVAAAEAGLIGYRPTAGIVSRYGLIGLIPSMESPGIVARDVETIIRIVRAVVGPDEGDFSLCSQFPDFADPGTGGAVKTAAVIPQSLAGLDATEAGAFEAALVLLKEMGAAIREVPVEGYDLFRTVHQVVGAAEASSSAGKYDSVRYGHRVSKADDWNEMYLKSREESFGPVVKAFLFQGAYFQFKDYAGFENACRIRRQVVQALDEVLNDADVIVLPTRKKGSDTCEAQTVSQVYDRFALTLAANAAGLPAVTLPGFVRADAGDLGLQLVGPRLSDARLLACAAQLGSTRMGDR